MIQEYEAGQITGFGSGPLADPRTNSGTVFADVISGAISVMTIVAAIWFLFQIITGGIEVIGAGGDKQKLEGARTKITNGIIGFVVVISATFLLNLITYLLGFEGINILNIRSLIIIIGP